MTWSANESGMPSRRHRQLARLAAAVALLDRLDAPLDLAHVVEIVGRAARDRRRRACARAASTDSRTQSRMLRSSCRRSRRASASSRADHAEHLIEDDARIANHRQRLVRRRPADRVGVDARVAVAAAAGLIDALDAQLHRRNRRVLAEALRVQLIHRDAALDVGAFGPLRIRLRQVRRARAEVIAADLARLGRIGARHVGVADDRDVIAKRLRAASGWSATDRSARPVAAGAHRFCCTPYGELPAAPWTFSMQIRRDRSVAPWRRARGETIASRKGRATVAPIPFSTSRGGDRNI